MLKSIPERIALEVGVTVAQVEAAIALLDEGATVPFIARYRKEATMGLDDIQLRSLEERLGYMRELEARRKTILAAIQEQGKLTPELEALIQNAETKTRLEDLYLPYKRKRRTKAQIAREAGLEPLATSLLEDPTQVPEESAKSYVDAEKGVADGAAALEGARQILMERFSEDAELIGGLRELLWEEGSVVSKVAKGKDEEGSKFADYFEYQEGIKNLPSHRALALFRGRKEGMLRTDLRLCDEDEADPKSADSKSGSPKLGWGRCEGRIGERFGVRDEGRPADAWLSATVRLAWRVKISLSLQLELMGRLRDEAEEEAIRVFGTNLSDLLLAAPAGSKTCIGLDPGIRTGVKVAVVDETGKLVDTATIYPHQPRNDWTGSLAVLSQLATKHKASLIAIGNGTASRETDKLAGDLIKALPELGLSKIVVSEAGASVYSASELGSKEFPDVDVSLRGAVSIARRLQDPLAELVKIDPKAIGVGQYQHDVSQVRLSKQLVVVVEDCVNSVGVNLNMASVPLLTRVSGLTSTLAENIVAHRDANGAFATRRELLKVARLGPKAFEQAAGFLKIRDGKNPLDASAVHPEAYPLVKRILNRDDKKISQVIGNKAYLASVNPTDFIDEKFGLPTVTDILKELEKPGRDPRPEFKTASFQEGVEEITDLKPDMILEGVVSNVANFGAFVDLGVHQDGLVHISQLSHDYVSDPREVVKAGQVVRVKVLSVDIPRRRIALTMCLQEKSSDHTTRRDQKSTDNKPQRGGRQKPRSSNSSHGTQSPESRPESRRQIGEAPANPFAEQLSKLKDRFK